MSGSRYAIQGEHNTAADTVLSLTGSTTVKGKIYYFKLCSDSSPADATIEWHLKRKTDAGTGTSVTPEPLNPDDRIAVATALQAHSVEPTYAGVPVLGGGLNQRSVFQWYAEDGGEVITAKAANAGWGCLLDAFSSGTPNMVCTMHFKE